MSGRVHHVQTHLSAVTSDDLMTEAELAAEWKIKPKTLANQRSRRVGPPYLKLSGGIVRYSRAAVRRWVEANTVSHGGPPPAA